MEPRNSITLRTGRTLHWLVLAFVFAVIGNCGAAPEPLYQNLSDSQYFLPSTHLNPPNSPPQIDAYAFDNESTFSVEFDEGISKVETYETSDTLFYTNGDNGLMIADGLSYGAGFQFDDKTSLGHQMSSVFYNSGIIHCESALDGDDFFGDVVGLGFFNGLGTCNIFASNIYNPGNIELGINSLLQINGNTVDLSRSVLDIENIQFSLAADNFDAPLYYNNIQITSVGSIGFDTNFDWNPGLDLTATQAISSLPQDLYLSNSLSYFKIDSVDGSASNFIARAVFVENDSLGNVTNNVYIQPLDTGLDGDGTAFVEWVGTYTDPASGNRLTNYLYLQDDYVYGASTNVQITPGPGDVGYPDNFTFYSSTNELLSGPITAGFDNIFANQAITNPYAYLNGNFRSTTVGTNVGVFNPNGTITNIVGRIEINASNELNLNNVLISGQNYLSIQSPKQFDGSAGASISSAFSDINVGVTNGQLNVTNLLVSQIPIWSGNVQAWSTRYTNFAMNGNILATVDYRILLVKSRVQPVTQPWVQNLALHTGTNLVVSDDFNVYGTLYLDAQNLTITTNGVGAGATSVEGELNAVFTGNIGHAQWPNLMNVTNNGVLSSVNLISFTNYSALGSVINNGVISDYGTVINATNFLNSGSISNLGAGSMSVTARSVVLTNGTIMASGGVTFAANNFVASNSTIQCLSLTLTPTNSVTDSNTVGNVWVVGKTNSTGGNGFALLNNPANGDLLGTTITNICPPANKLVKDTWAGKDYGASNNGFTNNAALGHLVLNAAGSSSLITFTGTGASNALYVDALELQGTLTNGLYNNYNFTNWLALNTNITIYFAQAYINGISVAEAINQASVYSGENGGYVSNNIVVRPGRLRWVPSYAGIFSSTNYVVNGVTNVYNAALAESKTIDSDGSGMANANNPSPFFTAQQINFGLTVTNAPVRQAVLSWTTVPLATNTVYFTTSLATNNWQLYTNFHSTSVLGSPYVTKVSDTNVLKGIRFYKVLVQPWLTYPY